MIILEHFPCLVSRHAPGQLDNLVMTHDARHSAASGHSELASGCNVNSARQHCHLGNGDEG